VRISITDQGCGIPKDKIKKLGEPFYTTKERGTGLGLMVSYKIIEEHRGKIDVESEVGVGTTFHITLPIERTEREDNDDN
jgi:two-component system, sporulation sensor kinase E